MVTDSNDVTISHTCTCDNGTWFARALPSPHLHTKSTCDTQTKHVQNI